MSSTAKPLSKSALSMRFQVFGISRGQLAVVSTLVAVDTGIRLAQLDWKRRICTVLAGVGSLYRVLRQSHLGINRLYSFKCDWV